MIDWATVYTNISGSYPNVLAINASGPGTTDGTEYSAGGINNGYQAFSQNILNYAGLTPDGVSESTGGSSSQIIEAIQKGFGIGPGKLVGWYLDDDPSVTGDRVLLLNGQGVLRATYADLDAACYVGDGNNAAVAAGGGAFYRADNSDGSSPSTTGVYLILPESRGYALRGLDAAASVDPQGASRYLGDNQVDAMQRITGNMDFSSNLGARTAATLSGVFSDGVATGNNLASQAVAGKEVAFDSSGSTSPNTAKTDDVETRMSNLSIKWGITY
jgi:hypothetical protein